MAKLLQDHHLTAESAPSGLSITASGKAADVNKLFNVKVDRARYHHEPLQFGKTAPSFPQDLARSVLAVVGLTEHNSAYL
ncbi:peptidase S53, partial [Lactobacillus sp. XV13L]|nr:peptidase S53 [Lactobacillus sp. XV13L]